MRAHYLFSGMLQVISRRREILRITYLRTCSLRHIIKTLRKELKPAIFQTPPSLIPSAWMFSASDHLRQDGLLCLGRLGCGDLGEASTETAPEGLPVLAGHYQAQAKR
jgi:hypothetical protein